MSGNKMIKPEELSKEIFTRYYKCSCKSKKTSHTWDYELSEELPENKAFLIKKCQECGKETKEVVTLKKCDQCGGYNDILYKCCDCKDNVCHRCRSSYIDLCLDCWDNAPF